MKKALYPPKGIRYGVPPAAFTVVIVIFTLKQQDCVWAYPVYVTAAYGMAVVVMTVVKDVPKLKKKAKTGALMQKVNSTTIGARYCSDLAFRGTLSIYEGMIINFLYAIFRVITGICYGSVWFLSMAAYHLVLGGMREYLAVAYRRKERMGASYQSKCYRKTAGLLLLLNIPMGGMIFLVIQENSAYQYPGYIIYLSVMYTFYTIVLAIINLFKYRKLGSPILSAAKILNFVSAMMSVFGLQTAMIAHFSTEGETFRKLMNTITGSFVYGSHFNCAVYIVFRIKTREEEALSISQRVSILIRQCEWIKRFFRSWKKKNLLTLP